MHDDTEVDVHILFMPRSFNLIINLLIMLFVYRNTLHTIRIDMKDHK